MGIQGKGRAGTFDGNPPVRDVSGAHHGGNVDHRVPGYTGTVGLWVLTNQVAGEESTMGTTHEGHTPCIKVFLLEHLLHCKLKGGQSTLRLTPHQLNGGMNPSSLSRSPSALLPGHPSHPGGPHCLGEKGCCLGQSQWSHGSSLKVRNKTMRQYPQHSAPFHVSGKWAASQAVKGTSQEV